MSLSMTVFSKSKNLSLITSFLTLASCATQSQYDPTSNYDPSSKSSYNTGKSSSSNTQSASSGSADPSCEKYYNSHAQSPLFFLGYGTGYDVDAAKQAASVDLVSQIRTNITSTTTVSDSSQHGTDVSSRVESKVNEYVTGLKVIKRCKNRYHEAVVRLSKRDFTSGVGQVLATKLQKVQELEQTVSASPENARVLMQAKAFIDTEGTNMESDLQMCRTFKGCGGISLASLTSLRQSVHNNFSNLSFRFEPMGHEAVSAAQSLRSVLSQDGVVIASVEDEGPNAARARCEEFVYPKNESISYRIVEVRCEVRGFSNGEEAFVYKYVGKASHSDVQAAIAVARSKLKKKNL